MRVQGATNVLSNFFIWSMQFMGMMFPSVEHAYQFVKARFHGRPDLCQQILKATTPGAAKRLTKQITVTTDWNDQRQCLMAELLDIKFRSCPPFRQTLLSSDDFIDHTVPDTYWGTGIDKRDPGQNVFGLLLARLRNRHQIPDDKKRVLVLGHSFISHLKTRIDDGRVSFEDPKEHPGMFHPLFVGLSGATLEMLSNYVRSTHLLEHYNYPHIIILQVGGNDISNHHFEESAFLDSLDNFTSYCRSLGCTVIVMGIWKRLRPRYCSVSDYETRRMNLHLALQNRSSAVSFWFYSSRIVAGQTRYLDGKGVHPSDNGYIRLCRSFSRALGWLMVK